MSGRRVAAFDFDGTLTRRDTLMPFLVRACGAHRVANAVARVGPYAARARLGRLEHDLHHRDATKAALIAMLLRGREAKWLAAEAEAFATTLPGRLRPEMVDRVAWHRGRDHELVIVSASLATYLVPFAEAEGFDHVIAVEMETDVDGTLTGQMVGGNVRGPEKQTRLRAWLGGESPVEMWAYGNSSGDNELLAIADHPVWVAGPNAKKKPPR